MVGKPPASALGESTTRDVRHHPPQAAAYRTSLSVKGQTAMTETHMQPLDKRAFTGTGPACWEEVKLRAIRQNAKELLAA